MARTPEKLKPGDLLKNGEITLLSRLGLGGFGEVFLARTPVGLKAVKVVDTAVWSEKEYQVFNAMLMAEASFLSTLDHPALPKSAGFFAEGKRYFLVMDWVQGQTLESFVEREGPLDLDELLSLVGVLIGVLGYLHRKCEGVVVFGDLKPANIPRTGPGLYRLVDLGLVSRQGTKMSQRYAVFSPKFSAPERARGKASHPSQDIFSLGATCYFALTGREPRTGSSDKELEASMRQRLDQAGQIWGEASVHCLKKLLTLFLGALDPDPHGRPGNVLAFQEAWSRVKEVRERETREVTAGKMDDLMRFLYRKK